MRKFLVIAAVLPILPLATFAGMTIAEEGKAKCVIVLGDDLTNSEEFAGKELSEHLGKITGAKFELRRESELEAGVPAIFLGRTNFAEKAGVNSKSLEDEEWHAKTFGESLVLAGGRPRGTLYAVYDFLEKQAGCLWMDEHNTFIPSAPTLRVGDLNKRKKPAFRLRDMFDGLSGNPASILFKTRNKGYCLADAGMGGRMMFGGPGKGANHMSFWYVRDCPEALKEKVAGLSSNGKRIFPMNATGNQLCWTSQECKDLALESLRKFVAQDRKNATATGLPPPLVYDISPTDNGQYCQCENCKRMAEEEGSYSGPLLDFINHIATKIKEEHPDIQIRTLAYIGTQEPPRRVKAADNVIIQVAILGSECSFPPRVSRDTMRELSHPNNKAALDLIERWARTASKLSIYDYWGLVYSYNTFFENVMSLRHNLLTYHKMNVIDVSGESCGHLFSNFFSLNRWMLYKLMDEPRQDPEELMNKFFTCFYGKGATQMREYLRYMNTRQEELRQPPGEVFLINRNYADTEFFLTSLKFIDRAEKLAEGDDQSLANIRRERAPLLAAMLEKWGRLPKEAIKLDKNALVEQYVHSARATINYYLPLEPFPPWLDTYPKFRQEWFDRIDRNAQLFSQDHATPPELEGKTLVDVPLLYIDWSNKSIKLADDPASARGKALICSGKALEKEKIISFEVYNNERKEWLAKKHIPIADAPKDEKYHLYNVGHVRLDKERCTLAVTQNWSATIPLNQILPPDRQEEGGKYDVYVSAKLQGPKYAPESTLDNAFLMDGVYLVRVE